MSTPPNPRFLAPPTIHRREWWLAGCVAVIAVAWSLFPTIMGLRQTPLGQQYLYSNVPDTSDTQIYYAFIDQNAQGHVLYKNLFTSEPQKAVLFNPLWLTLGGIERLTGYPADLVFTAARAVVGLALVIILFLLICHFIASRTWRQVALWVAVFGAGLGGLILLIHHGDPRLVWIQTQTPILRSLPADLTYAAGFTWLSLGHSPLFEIAQVLLLGSWLLLWRGQRLGLAAVLIGLLAFIHPYDLVLFFGVAIGHAVIGIMTNQMTPETIRAYLRTLMKLALATLPAVIYYSAAMVIEPTLREWYRQNILYSPPLTSLIAGYGLMSIGAFVGGRRALHQSSSGLLAVSWLAGGAMLSYFPAIPFQAKMISLLNVPVAILSVIGFRHVFDHLRSVGLRVATAVVIVAITFSTAVIFPLRIARAQLIEPVYHYASTDLLESLRWLRDNSAQNTIVFGDYTTGNLVPQYAARSAWLGHNIQTINYLTKLAIVRRWFFVVNDQAAEKAQFLHDQHINYVVWSPNERRWGDFDPSTLTILHPVFRRGAVTVFRVE